MIDSLHRVFFLPEPNTADDAYADFTFIANDGEANSAPASVAIRIVGRPFAATQPPLGGAATNATLSGMATANDATAVAWFEWGTSPA